MQAIRQIQKVTNHSVTVQLPADFQADEVEIIVRPVEYQQNGTVSTETDAGVAAMHRFLTMDTSHLSAQQLIAYQRSCEKLLKSLETPGQRQLDLLEGLIEFADDFDDSDEITELFYTSKIEPD